MKERLEERELVFLKNKVKIQGDARLKEQIRHSPVIVYKLT